MVLGSNVNFPSVVLSYGLSGFDFHSPLIGGIVFLLSTFLHTLNIRCRLIEDSISSGATVKSTQVDVKNQLGYDPADCESVRAFCSIAQRSQCIFAKRAVLWGSPKYESSKSIESNILASLQSLHCFVRLADAGANLDGYVLEIQNAEYSRSVVHFAALVRKVLTVISRHDPCKLSCMDMKSISSSSWYFSFATVPIFVTTFAPCYGNTHSRYMFLDSAPELATSCFILLQPEISFLRHGLDPDTPHTNWDAPVSFRDKIRVNFRNHGRGYFIPATTAYPVATAIVPSETNSEVNHSPIHFWDEQLYPDAKFS